MPLDIYKNLRKIFYGEEALEMIHAKSNETDYNYQMKSFLSVIADSGIVEAYILDRHHMSYLDDFYLRKVFEKIAMRNDCDRPLNILEVE